MCMPYLRILLFTLIVTQINVQVGDKVQKGQVICIIEAMKLMNEIEVCCYIALVYAILQSGFTFI